MSNTSNIVFSEERRKKIVDKYITSKMDNKMQPERIKGGMPGGPGPRGMRGNGGKPKDTKAVVSRIFKYISADKIKIGFVFICVIITSVSSLLATAQLQPIIDLLKSDAAKADKVDGLLSNLLIMLLYYALGIVSTFLQQYIMVGVSQRAISKIRGELYAKLTKLPLRYHDSHNTGDLMSLFTNDVDTIGEMLNNTIVQFFSCIITIVGVIVMMFRYSVILAIINILMLPLIGYLGGSIAKKSRKYYKGQQASLGAVNSYIEETVTGQKVVKVFNHEDMAVEEFTYLSDELQQNQMKAQFFGGIMGPVMGNSSQISFSITATIGGILCLVTNTFSVGALTVFATYSRQLSRPVNEISMQFNTIFSALAGAERVFKAMDEEPEKDNENAKELVVSGGEVEINDVTFGYVPDKTVLKNINVTAKQGEKIAFVGSTGAGKTTITNLITRFYDVEKGEIKIDGTKIDDVTIASLRSNIAVILQDTHLFTGTIRENIRYGRLDATDEEVEKAAEVAAASHFIKRLEHGYDTMIEGDGANLSQGQRQLLNIARAAISKAPILIMDEATSSVDTRTEKHIEHGMDRLMKNRTTFVIAHRLSTVRNAQKIIVLEHGEIVEAGTHEELLANKNRYYQLYTGAVELD